MTRHPALLTLMRCWRRWRQVWIHEMLGRGSLFRVIFRGELPARFCPPPSSKGISPSFHVVQLSRLVNYKSSPR